MQDLKFVPLTAKSGVIAYRLVEKGSSHGKEFAAESAPPQFGQSMEANGFVQPGDRSAVAQSPHHSRKRRKRGPMRGNRITFQSDIVEIQIRGGTQTRESKIREIP